MLLTYLLNYAIFISTAKQKAVAPTKNEPPPIKKKGKPIISHSAKWYKTMNYSKIFEADDVVFIHFHGADGREIKTRDYGHPHPVYEENGKTGVYYGEGFTPFDEFSDSVTFERAL